MGGGQSQAQKLQSQRKQNKPQLPQHQTPDQHYQFLISDPVSRYIWNASFEYESLIYEIIIGMSIKRYLDYLQYFKPHMRYIKKAEKLYSEVVQCCLYESKFNDQDKKYMQGVLILLFNLYHIEKFRVIFSSSQRTWWEGLYFDTLAKHVNLPINENESYITTFVNFMIDHFQKRFQEVKPQNENKKVDLVSVRVLADYYLQYLYGDVVSYLTDTDPFMLDYALSKQHNYTTQGRCKLSSNIKIITRQQKQQQQLLYQQQLHNATPSQQIEDMERQFRFLSDTSIKPEPQLLESPQEQIPETSKQE